MEDANRGPDRERLGQEHRPPGRRSGKPGKRQGDGGQRRVEHEPDRIEQQRGEVDRAEQPWTDRKGSEAAGIEERLALRQGDQPEPHAPRERKRDPGGEDRQRTAQVSKRLWRVPHAGRRLEDDHAKRGAEHHAHQSGHGSNGDADPLPAVHEPAPPEPRAQGDQRVRLLEREVHGRKESGRVPPRPSPTRLTNASVSVVAPGTAWTTPGRVPCATRRPRWITPTRSQSRSTTSSTWE